MADPQISICDGMAYNNSGNTPHCEPYPCFGQWWKKAPVLNNLPCQDGWTPILPVLSAGLNGFTGSKGQLITLYGTLPYDQDCYLIDVYANFADYTTTTGISNSVSISNSTLSVTVPLAGTFSWEAYLMRFINPDSTESGILFISSFTTIAWTVFNTPTGWSTIPGSGFSQVLVSSPSLPPQIPSGATGIRLRSVVVNDDWTVDVEAEPYIYGVHSPLPVTTAAVNPFVPNPINDPGNVNTPIIFEPVPRLFGSQNQPQLWAVVSASSPNYGGCYAYVSTDGGSSYNPVSNLATGSGAINGNGVTGYSTSDWPAHADPDTTNDLPVDLTESLGNLSSYSSADRDNFTYPCYVAVGSSLIPYGLMTYNTATMTAANKFTLKATGGGNELRRCVFGAPNLSPDVDHPNNSRFAFLGNASQQGAPGLMKLTMDPKWIGVTLYFKFLPFNTFGNVTESLSALVAYSYTPTGKPSGITVQNQSYTQSPLVVLTQPSGTSVAMAQATTTFGTNSVNYNARTFTITNPSVPTTYYVTIADPGYTGDIGSGTTLAATCQTSNALVGVPGNTFMGFIVAIPGGGAGATAAPGGWPQPQSAIVTS